MTAPQVAVAQPPPFTTEERLSILIHGWAKRGKSTTAATAPKPILALDAEGSWRFVPGRKIYWDPMSGAPPPTYDGSWEVCIVHVRSWETVAVVYNWLSQYQLPFVTVVIDSITEIQRRARASLKSPTEALKIQDWGVLLSLLDQVIRGFRDLCLHPQLAVRCVVFVAESKDVNGRLVPSMQGQIGTALPYWVDLVGFLYEDWEINPATQQPGQEVRRFWIGPNQRWEAGERVQGRLGQCQTIVQPPPGYAGRDIENWMHIVFHQQSNGVYPQQFVRS